MTQASENDFINILKVSNNSLRTVADTDYKMKDALYMHSHLSIPGVLARLDKALFTEQHFLSCYLKRYYVLQGLRAL